MFEDKRSIEMDVRGERLPGKERGGLSFEKGGECGGLSSEKDGGRGGEGPAPKED